MDRVVITGRHEERLSAIGEETGAATIVLEARDDVNGGCRTSEILKIPVRFWEFDF